jgi:2-polyprenyl-3-methyl-5-hydroxy-6-metoxy-1,4-benzoquinol methylase
MQQEQERIDQTSNWYLSEQLDFDVQMIRFRYRSIRPHLVGLRGCELGPAEGQMTRFLLDDFESLTIVDAAADLLHEIPSHSKLTKVHSLFEDYAPETEFDTIVMEHILEHVEFPVELLKSAARWLATDQRSRVLVGVPNANSFHRLAAVKMGMLQTPNELNPRDIALGHRRVYSLDELCSDVEAAGLRTVSTGGVYMKPLANSQIQQHWTDEMIEAFYEMGKDFPEHAAEIFVVAERS